MFKLSASKLKTYKACKRKYELSYIENLEPIKKEEALEIGSNYHKNIEKILKGEVIEKGEINSEEDAKVYAMSKAFEMYIKPNLPEIQETEKSFEICIDKDRNYYLNGIVDAITKDGIIVEHKTTSLALDEKYQEKLNWDDQVPIYMLANDTTECIYTVCQKPTIRLKKDESLEEYADRCIEWYNEKTDEKIGTFKIKAQQEDILEEYGELINMCEEMEKTKNFYRNSSNCNIVSCPYSSICINYDKGATLVNFKKKEENI